MSNRDDFSPATKRILAYRAGYHCSFTGCRQLTVGPSDESSSSIAGIGRAAHICGAAVGGPRYDPSMSPDQRSHIDNGIWMCANHAALIDGDKTTYTVAALRAMKREHDTWCKAEVKGGSTDFVLGDDLIGVGPDVVCVGGLVSIEATGWSIQLKHFVIGDPITLITFIDRFPQSKPSDLYVLLNALGDGRVLTGPPDLAKNSTGYILKCPVAQSFPRIDAHHLGSQLAVSPKTNDLFVENHQIGRVSGLASLPQNLRQCLSLMKGESPFHPDFGTRFSEYYESFRDSPWLDRLLKLETIFQASIPYHDPLTKEQYTPLRCVDRVRDIVPLADAPQNQRLPVRFELDVHGVGPWTHEIAVLIPSNRELSETVKKMQALIRMSQG